MTFLLNCWYLAAWTADVPVGGHLFRRIAGKPLIIARDSAGLLSALLDRCPHRFVPLSRGQIRDDKIVCAYHGIAFDLKGRCIANPHGAITSALTVPGFVVTERHHAIWVWLGDADKADPASIMDLSLMDSLPDTAQNFGYELIQANYQLCADNILDLSHADYLHPDSLGGGATTRAKQSVEETPEALTVKWLAKDDVIPPALDGIMREKGQPGDVHISVRWQAPSVMMINFGADRPHAAEPDRAETWGIHVMVPIDDKSTHYFFWTGRDKFWDADFNELVRQMTTNAFVNEDKPLLEAQQANLGDGNFEDLQPALLTIDNASVRARRRLKTMIEAETV
jgi:phenylpropionate dioxygenase-like ring-hydroxylating dioxygenase large terminal subunit